MSQIGRLEADKSNTHTECASSSLSLLLAATIHESCVSAYAVPEIVFDGKTQGSIGAVASEATECSSIGTDLLARGVCIFQVNLFGLVANLIRRVMQLTQLSAPPFASVSSACTIPALEEVALH